ncbi:MAG: hypothetical protein H0W61_03180 [Bacteroidetes bacterium]|nr:hypothetical protein [Bacteroidota bacterium]
MIRKAITYFIFITVLLFGLRELHYYGLLKQKEGYYAKYKTAFFQKNHYTVLFLGSSRVEMHYNTQLFDTLTGENSFNLSLAGATPQVAFAALKAYLVNSAPPEKLFYEIDYHFIKNKSNEIKEFNNYFPFLKNETLRSEFSKIDNRMNHFYYDPYFSFPYTGFKNLSTSVHGWMGVPNLTDSLYYKGYLKEVLRPHLKYDSAQPVFSYFNITDRNYLDSIIILCQKNKTIISLITSPLFAGGKLDVANKEQVISHLQNIAGIHKIEYYNFSSLSFCNQRTLFVDHFHMNAGGASEYTHYFASFYNNKWRGNALK